MRLWVPETSNVETVKGQAVYLRTLPDLTRIYTTVWRVELRIWYQLEGLMAVGTTGDIITMARQCGIKLERNDKGILCCSTLTTLR